VRSEVAAIGELRDLRKSDYRELRELSVRAEAHDRVLVRSATVNM
jgi:hypothetical protein